MIISQPADHRPPKSSELKDIFAQIRRIADTDGVPTRQHHDRCYNKMADAAVNQSLDPKPSGHAPPEPQHRQIQAHMHGDVQAWTADRYTQAFARPIL
ncbi:TPA: hypothetical protein N0F65_004034 [Lagenidium giganteum]|uniref:RNase H type-1 domain-containing protein n=1 Tax=Lagenidium giganteum TaxID=4803 RepID=A0AAV2YX96_9STRA|nr:TPA: hypothetical protein N0F65_004034 [Lagenidium giganteum]